MYKYLNKDNFSPQDVREKTQSLQDRPVCGHHPRLAHKDLKEWKKQRHTAHRIWERLVKEIGANICESSVRAFVAKERSRIKAERDAMGYMDLE